MMTLGVWIPKGRRCDYSYPAINVVQVFERMYCARNKHYIFFAVSFVFCCGKTLTERRSTNTRQPPLDHVSDSRFTVGL